MSRKLNKPKNYRRKTPRCCHTCRFSYFSKDTIHLTLVCMRDEEVRFDLHSSEWDASYLHVCDYYEGPFIRSGT